MKGFFMVIVQPTSGNTLPPLRKYTDSQGNNYELRLKDEETNKFGAKTRTLELYKQNKYGSGYTLLRDKKETYLLDQKECAKIEKTKYNMLRKPSETVEISRQLSGYDIKVNNDALSMSDKIMVLHTTDAKNNTVTKVKLPDKINIHGNMPFSPMTKRIFGLFKHAK